MSRELKNLKKYVKIANMTSTFKTLMNQYKTKLKLSRELNKEFILKEIYSKIQKIENEERENDFIFSEVKRNAQIDKEILYSFGTKALNHLNEVIKVNVTTKMDKNRFLGIDDYKNEVNKKLKFRSVKNRLFQNSKINHTNKDNKFIKLPRISTKNYESEDLNENSLINNRMKTSATENKIFNNIKKINLPKNFRKSSGKTFNYSSFRKEKNSEMNSSTIKDLTPIKKRKENSNDSIVVVNQPLSTDRASNKLHKLDYDYIDYLRNMGNHFQETEKKQENYFYKNKYGVDAFKLKYNYLTKKFFK